MIHITNMLDTCIVPREPSCYKGGVVRLKTYIQNSD